jgi:hypothetical protein
MTAFAKAEDAALGPARADRDPLGERRIVPHSLAGWFAVGMCVLFVAELVVTAGSAVFEVRAFQSVFVVVTGVGREPHPVPCGGA